MAMFGRRESVNQRPAEARALAHSSMVGTGMAMEGIHNSYVMYDLLSEMSWRHDPVPDLDHWFQVSARHRDISQLFISLFVPGLRSKEIRTGQAVRGNISSDEDSVQFSLQC